MNNMPVKVDKINLPDKLDRRIKLTTADKEEIKFQYSCGQSINGLARLYNVNKRSIQFILFPERHEQNLADRKLNGGSKKYYNREKHSASIKNLREYKRDLLKKGLIK